jgi:hypothetical protein
LMDLAADIAFANPFPNRSPPARPPRVALPTMAGSVPQVELTAAPLTHTQSGATPLGENLGFPLRLFSSTAETKGSHAATRAKPAQRMAQRKGQCHRFPGGRGMRRGSEQRPPSWQSENHRRTSDTFRPRDGCGSAQTAGAGARAEANRVIDSRLAHSILGATP